MHNVRKNKRNNKPNYKFSFKLYQISILRALLGLRSAFKNQKFIKNKRYIFGINQGSKCLDCIETCWFVPCSLAQEDEEVLFDKRIRQKLQIEPGKQPFMTTIGVQTIGNTYDCGPKHEQNIISTRTISGILEVQSELRRESIDNLAHRPSTQQIFNTINNVQVLDEIKE